MNFGVDNPSKIYKKSIKKSDQKSNAILDGFWMALGAFLERFGAHLGAQVGAKLGPKSIKNQCRQKHGTKKPSEMIKHTKSRKSIQKKYWKSNSGGGWAWCCGE